MRIFIIVLAVIYCAGASLARSIIIEADDCPLPVNGAPTLVADAEHGDLNPWRESGSDIKPAIKIQSVKRANDGQSFSWVRSTSQTGETTWRRKGRCAE